ncbi:conserved hypothetical protein [Neisseria gonorrhoeae DGI2]|uniref:Uncharacterized protein n=1 Tax=Neisseria gonorrhoeae (strain NCCP11945) TaxID=521006 RepID=B4RM89_NEIG2|nr:Hypothetical protein NGK_1249 [Neisseria gonorrhoeae NCCP11945]EEZ54997.1 predicted protein [Neisseria gonorrhoeae PID332]EEZ57154.1 predicted protein [Neisseria gonorrhoeae SK-92-679]EEZ59464.1 predicted protein [Neisseria gonorrhoeae SK-93-1035]EFE04096.1 conserved hypothetical protein [Neisseria gonorrhoeae DGI2]
MNRKKHMPSENRNQVSDGIFSRGKYGREVFCVPNGKPESSLYRGIMMRTA